MKTTNSEALFQQSLKYTPLGTQTLSKAPDRYVNGVYPKLISHGKGSKLYDYDGNEFIDYIGALGPITVGYADDSVNSAVREQLEKGVLFSLPSAIEGEAARTIASLIPSMEMSKFTKTGSEACTMAVKAARAYTKRDKVLVCGYHGWHDWYSILNDKKAGIPLVLSAYIERATYNDLASFEVLRDEHFACVIMEPMVWEYPKPGFLESVKLLCATTGTLLIFDEVVTGGRFERLTAQSHLGVKPDLTVLSKGIANGFAMAVVGGSRNVMETFERDDFFASGTFGGDCLGLVAMLETFRVLEKALPRMVERGEWLKRAMTNLFGPSACKGYPTRTAFDFPTVAHKALFWQECVKRGVLFGYSNFISASHTYADLEETVDVMYQAASVLRKFWNSPTAAIEGSLPVEALRMR